MPELPEVEVYVARLRSRLAGQALERVRIRSFVLMNYCAGCQTGGQLLSDRSPARLLKEDWPRTLKELQERRR